jgi:vesicle coat complex subunit
VYEVNPTRVEQVGLLEKLKEMLYDGNGMVVSNAVAAISEIA